MSPLKELILTVLGFFAFVALVAFLLPRFGTACDITAKPLVIECLAHGGSQCIEQVQTLNGCVFK